MLSFISGRATRVVNISVEQKFMVFGCLVHFLLGIVEFSVLLQSSISAMPSTATNEDFKTDLYQLQKIEGTENMLDSWKIVEELYDDRVLTWGTDPTDSLKFWASLTKKLRDSMVNCVKKLGLDIKDHPKIASTIKAKCLQKVAMVLCDAGEYGDALDLAASALSFESCPDRVYEIKVLLIYATHNKQKEPMWVDDTKDTSGYRKLAELCKNVIENGKNLSASKLCKVYIMKAFTLYSMMNRSRLVFK